MGIPSVLPEEQEDKVQGGARHCAAPSEALPHLILQDTWEVDTNVISEVRVRKLRLEK